MGSTITIVGNDVGFVNWGVAVVDIDVTTMEMSPVEIALLSTAPGKNKGVRVSSDNLRRARELAGHFTTYEKQAHICAAEIPSGAQSAKASYAFGLVVGVLSHHRKPLIEVTPTEVKKAVTGYAGASKQEMIEWATEFAPHLAWRPGQGKKWADKNEHMADALAIVYTAVRTEQFKAAAAIFAVNTAA